MAYAPAVSRYLRQAGHATHQVFQIDKYLVSVWAPDGASMALLKEYAQAIPDKYHVRLDPAHPTECLIVSDRDHPDWESVKEPDPLPFESLPSD